MPLFRCLTAGFVIISSSSIAVAGETPLYQPAPNWVVATPDFNPSQLTEASPPFVLYDAQQRIEDGRLWTYIDIARRIASPELLAQMATITVPWLPDKGDLIVHELSIIRGNEHIDLLAKGQKFTVLRREESLEQRELTGVLTATLAVEGLRVGDVLRIKMTTSAKDDALDGRVQLSAPLLVEPLRVGSAKLRISWPTASTPRWKVLGKGVLATPSKNGKYTDLLIALPVAKQPEMPDDAPPRFRNPPLIEVSSFANWADVSKVMAPLYRTEGTIVADSPIAAEVAAIMAADATPLGRAQRALEVVQDKIRYLAIGMDGGNYVPQTPAHTWTTRYGDCKAKTLLLLAMLRSMNIEAEPVLAHVGLGDFIADRLPSAGAFNHILVRATIGGEIFWLDGTGSGSRMQDVRDTPALRYVLPVRPTGADLIAVATHANARPTIDISIDADESASVDLPTVFDATAVIRGNQAAMLTVASTQFDAKQTRETVGAFFQTFLGTGQFGATSIKPDPVAGTVTLSATGVSTTPWYTDDRKSKRRLSRVPGAIDFNPDRGRAAWAGLPIATPDPSGARFRMRLRLPDAGQGYIIEGERDFSGVIAGYKVVRKTTVANGIVEVDERIDSTGVEIPASQLADERDKVATVKAQSPVIVASKDGRRRWDLAGGDPSGATQVAAVDAAFGKAIVADPEEHTGYESRASFRNGIGNRKGAMADLDRAIAINPSVNLYLQRAAIAYELGDLAAALKDAEAARKLDPSSSWAVGRVSWIKAEMGDLPGAVALLDERIALGGETRNGYRQSKAAAIGEFGDPMVAIKLLDELILEKPGSPSLMNSRCWIKGIRSVMLDTALKDCTSAIELSSDSNAALDSRALVWYRLGRDEEALRDLDAVIASSPRIAESRFMRGVVLTRLKRADEAAKEFAIARRQMPSVDRMFGRYGIKP